MNFIQSSVNKSDLRRLARLARNYPRAAYKGLGRAGSVFRGKLRKVMRSGGGVEGVPRFAALDPITLQARRAFGSRVRKIGGELAKSSAVQMYRNGKAEFIVGFIVPLQAYARMLQTKEARRMTSGEKLRMRRAGIDPATYNRPAREVIKPFSDRVGREMGRLAIRLTDKIIEEELTRA